MNQLQTLDWSSKPVPATSAVSRVWVVECGGVYIPADPLDAEIDRLTPSNAELVEWAKRIQGSVPQSWKDEQDDPFRANG